MTYNWTPAAEVEMKRLYVVEGKSASEVAKALGSGCTRNAVIGKAHRLGWMKEHRQKPAAVGLKAPKVKRDRSTGAIVQNIAARKPPKPGPQNRPAVAFGKVEVVNAEETEKRRTAHRAHGEKIIDGFAAPANDTAIPLMSRRRFQCAWPVGDVSGAGQMCCGLPVDPDAPKTTASYCPTHRARASAGIPQRIRAPNEYAPRGAFKATGPLSASTLWDGARVA
jgi:GcrA cell cycle regulator